MLEYNNGQQLHTHIFVPMDFLEKIVSVMCCCVVEILNKFHRRE